MTLNEAIAESFSYQRRGALRADANTRSESNSKPKRLLQGHLALLMMESCSAPRLRSTVRHRIAIYVPDRDGPIRLGGGSTHAWCQAGFTCRARAGLEFDPTNGIVGNRDLIRVAVTRTPNQAIPLSGSYWGNAEDELGMDVSVNVKTLA